MLVSFTFRVSRECNACKMSLPLNGFVPSVRCYHCGEVNALGAAWWTFAVEEGHFAAALGFAEGEANESRVMSRKGNYVYAYGKRAPRCQACKGPDLDVRALADVANDGRCFCPGCGQPVRVRAADDLMRQINKRALYTVGETAAFGEEAAVQAKTRPVLFQCMGCGGTLSVDGSSRAVTCEHCQQSNYLPDGLWNTINPVPKPQVFFLVCQYDGASARDLRWTDEDNRKADAASSTDPLVLAQLARDDKEDVRTAAAHNPNTPPDVLDVLASDLADDIRVAVARNPVTALMTLIRLAADHDADVYGAVCARGDLPAEVCDQMAINERHDARALIASHPNLPLATLHALAKDDRDDVRTAAHERLLALKAQGVDVDAGRGFFAKLFG